MLWNKMWNPYFQYNNHINLINQQLCVSETLEMKWKNLWFKTATDRPTFYYCGLLLLWHINTTPLISVTFEYFPLNTLKGKTQRPHIMCSKTILCSVFSVLIHCPISQHLCTSAHSKKVLSHLLSGLVHPSYCALTTYSVDLCRFKTSQTMLMIKLKLNF